MLSVIIANSLSQTSGDVVWQKRNAVLVHVILVVDGDYAFPARVELARTKKAVPSVACSGRHTTHPVHIPRAVYRH